MTAPTEPLSLEALVAEVELRCPPLEVQIKRPRDATAIQLARLLVDELARRALSGDRPDITVHKLVAMLRESEPHRQPDDGDTEMEITVEDARKIAWALIGHAPDRDEILNRLRTLSGGKEGDVEALIASLRRHTAGPRLRENHAQGANIEFVAVPAETVKAAADALARLRLPAEGGGEWRPIETAPKVHGERILSTNRYGVVDTICWNATDNTWDDGFYFDLDDETRPLLEPTHWQPLPAAPAHPLEGGQL